MFDRTNRTLICSVVFLDIVEYSRQPVTEQMHLKEGFNGLLQEALQDIAVNDRIILDTGDGAAISFLGDPEDALFVAMNLRDACKQLSEEGQPIDVRIGINLGPVKLVKDINGRPNLIGDGINVAQRVMGFAEPGRILVSRSYYEVVSCLSEEYAQLFQHEGTRTDKHVREHEIYNVGFSEQIRQMPVGKRRGLRLPLSGADTHSAGRSKWLSRAAIGGAAVAVIAAGWLTAGHRRSDAPTPTPTFAKPPAGSVFKQVDKPTALATPGAGQPVPQPPSGIPTSNNTHQAVPVGAPSASPPPIPATNPPPSSTPAPAPAPKASAPASPEAPVSAAAGAVATSKPAAKPATYKPVDGKQDATKAALQPVKPKKPKPVSASTQPSPATATPTPEVAEKRASPPKRECPTAECYADGRPKHDK